MLTSHDIYYPLYRDKEHFIILITGGRASGKTFATSTFLERLTFELNKEMGISHQILYTRYTMVSANISIIPEVMEKIEMDGTGKYFHSTRTDIVNRLTGSRIMFRGIKASSGNQTAKLKSIQGITTFVCDEAEEWTSEKDFETMLLSLRQKGLRNRVIIIMNPTDSNHFIYQRYIQNSFKTVEYDGVPVQISTHPDVLHIHTTYLDNKENLSQNFLDEVERMKRDDPDKYAHQVMGRWADVAEGAVFTKWGVVKTFPEECRKVACGLDFGYTNDPSACVRCGIVGNDLYLDEVFYEPGLGVTPLADKLRGTGLFIYADSADRRLIDEIGLRDIVIYPVMKGPGSVIAGIEKMKDFDNIFVTERSYNLQEELRNYTWAKDKDGNMLNQPIDAYNHLIDATRYYINGHILGQVMRPLNITKDQLGIY